MPDIQLRFNKDMLVLSAPVDAMLERQGVDVARDRQYLNLMEPDALSDDFRLEIAAGAHCLVTTTEDITQARLARVRMDGDQARLAQAALRIANDVKPQHVLAEIGPCDLPLDAGSKASLNENRAQYANAARAFTQGEFDAFFLNGFVSIPDLKCALMGVAQVSDKPVIASVTLSADGKVPAVNNRDGKRSMPASSSEERGSDFGMLMGGYDFVEEDRPLPATAAQKSCLPAAAWPQAIEAMIDLGASVVGFETAEPIEKALAYAQEAVGNTTLPVLAQLQITPGRGDAGAKGLTPLEDITDYTPDTMAPCAVKLYGAGVQFLRATGCATPAYTGALAATVMGLDVLAR